MERQREEEHVSQGMPVRLVLLLAAGTGLAVANLYYAQPLLPEIARSFHASYGAAGLIVTLTQVGYAVGLALLVPLGDVLERHRLVVAVLLGAAVALAAASLAPSIALLAAIGVVIGLTSVVAQILVPFAADLAADWERGSVVGTVMSGLLIGILLARTVSGLVASLASWRAVFGIAALAMVALSAVLWLALPRRRPNTEMAYGRLLRSILDLVRRERVLRRRALYGALGFGAFNVFWTSMAFLLAGPPFRYGPGVIGAFGLIGAAGALVASVAGRVSDRGHAHAATALFAGSIAVSFLLLYWGAGNLVLLVAGIVLLDIGTQGLHITNQTVVYRLASAARSRITTAYMTVNFTGGAIGSALSVAVYTSRGWGGVCLLGGAMGAGAVLLWVLER